MATEEAVRTDNPIPVPIRSPRPIPNSCFHVQETVIHRPLDGQATEVVRPSDGYFSRILTNDEQPYRRTLTVGEEWLQLDFGWCAPGPAQLIILNEEGPHGRVIPTPEEIAAMYRRILVIGDPDLPYPFLRVRPQESCRFEPMPRLNYRIRCLSGKAKFTICCVPGDKE